MPYGLISLHEEMHLFFTILEFYKRLYPGVKFGKEEKMLTPKETGDVIYTYAGEEVEGLAAEKMREIIGALPEYSTPAIALRKGKKLIVLDGHRRLRVAYKRGLNWKCLIIVPSKAQKFGIEDEAMGTIREMYAKPAKKR